MRRRLARRAARLLPRRPEALALLAAVLALAFGVKSFYAGASFDDLRWLLTPTAALAGPIGGGAFELEPHEAYLCREARFAVVPACAGLNFTIVVLVSLVAGMLPLVRGWGRAAAWLGVSTVAALVVTVLAGALRIGLAMRLHAGGAGDDALRIAGTIVYLGCLVATYGLAARMGEHFHAAPAPR